MEVLCYQGVEAVMRLEMRSTMGQIGIENKKPVQTIRQPKGEQSIKQVKAKMIVDRELPRVHIDQRQCFSEVGLKTVSELSRENARLGRQHVMEEIARIAQEGNQMARIEDGRPLRTVIADIAEARAWRPVDITVDLLPKSRPKIEVTGHLNIDWKLGGAIINYKPNKAITRYQPGDVNIYVKRWHNLEINVVDKKV